MFRLHQQFDKAWRAVVAIAEVAYFAEFWIAIVVRVVGANPMATFAVERDRIILAGGETSCDRRAVRDQSSSSQVPDKLGRDWLSEHLWR